MPHRMTPQRFWSLVDRSSPDGCWPWTGYSIKSNGLESYRYGRTSYRAQTILAHRLAYLLTRGELADDIDVLHTCDNSLCCRPDHLFTGTHADNMADMRAKGRWTPDKARPFPKGTGHPNAKLDESAVRTMRERHARGDALAAIGADFNVSATCVHKVVTRKHWAHVE